MGASGMGGIVNRNLEALAVFLETPALFAVTPLGVPPVQR